MTTDVDARSNGKGALPQAMVGFAFLDGTWVVHNKRLEEGADGQATWRDFVSTASFTSLLNGLVSVEELRDETGQPFGSAIRSFDQARGVWSDMWISARDGVMQTPVEGRFEENVAVFTAPEVYQGKAMLVRGIWCRITNDEVTWEQASSVDDGQTWQDNWLMKFVRN